MTILTKDQIIAAKDGETKVVPVEEWGGDVVFAPWSGAARDEYEEALSNLPQNPDGTMKSVLGLRQLAVSLSLVDTNGERLFNGDGVAELGKKNADVIDRLFDIAREMNGLNNEAVEEAEKNSDGGPNADSG